MSRSTRAQFVQSAMPQKPRKRGIKEVAGFVLREVKRRMIASGELSDPATARAKWDWHWSYGERVGGVVQANTRGEARARIKQTLKLGKRSLPDIIKIVRVEPSADSDQCVAACTIGAVPTGSDSLDLRASGEAGD